MIKLRGKRPANLGVRDGKLAPCPNKPNCVSSQAPEGDAHRIEPLSFEGEPKAAWSRLAKVIEAQPRVEIVKRTDDYLYAEFNSALLGYVDDVEFWLPPNGKRIHVRSASRLGYSDLGVNRKRVEAIRAAFAPAKEPH